jgi:hypothetical protein
MDADSNLFSLEKALEKSPVVIIFYRGFWPSPSPSPSLVLVCNEDEFTSAILLHFGREKFIYLLTWFKNTTFLFMVFQIPLLGTSSLQTSTRRALQLQFYNFNQLFGFAI